MKGVITKVLVSILTIFIFSNIATGQGTVGISVSEAEGRKGETVCVEVTVSNFIDVETFGIVLSYDPSVVQPDCAAIDAAEIGSEFKSFFSAGQSCNTTDHLISLLGYLNSGVAQLSIPDGSVMYELCFELVGDPGDMTFLSSSKDFSLETYISVDGKTAELDFNRGKITVLPEPNTLAVNTSYCGTTNSAPNGGTIGFTIGGGTPPYSYAITGPTSTTGTATLWQELNIENLSAGTYTLTVEDSSTPKISDSQTIVIGNVSPVDFPITPTSPKCFGDEGKVEVNIKGGGSGAPYSIQMTSSTPGISYSSTRNAISAGTTIEFDYIYAADYLCMVQDANGCRFEQTINLSEPDKVEIENLQTVIPCSDSEVEIGGMVSGGSGTGYNTRVYNDERLLFPYKEFSGSIISGKLFPQWNDIDTFYIRAKDSEGCLSDTILLIPERPDTLVLRVDSTFQCDGYRVDIIAEGGKPFYSYSWSNDLANLESYDTELGIGSYLVTVTDANGCDRSIDFELDKDGSGSSISDSNVSVENAKCFNSSDGSITLSGINTNDWDITWYSGTDAMGTLLNQWTGKVVATDLSPGEYYIEFKGDCEDGLNVTVGAPDELQLMVSKEDVSCSGRADGRIEASATGGNDGGGLGRYTYSLVDTMTSITFPTASYSNLPARTYLVVVEDLNLCTDTVSIDIEEADPFSVLIDTENTKNKSCNNDNATLAVTLEGGTPDYTYLWQRNGQSYEVNIIASTMDQISNLPGGDYRLSVSDSKGCSTVLDTVFKVIDGAIAINFDTPTFDAIACHGETTCISVVNATGGSGSGYTYDTGDGVLYDLSECKDVYAGTYQVTVYDEDGCPSDPVEILVPEPDPVIVNVTDTINVKLGETSEDINVSVISIGLDSLVWTPTNDLIFVKDDKSIARSTTYTDQMYSVTAYDSDGCKGVASVFVDVNKSKRVAIANVFSPNGDGINDVFEVIVPKAVQSVESFIVYDRYGNPIHEVKDLEPVNRVLQIWNGKIKGENAMPNVYVWVAKYVFVDGTTATRTGQVTIMW